MLALWKLPLTLSDGTKVHRILSVNLRPRIQLEDESYVEGVNEPDDFPPTGAARITLADGSTVTVPYERAFYSMDLTTLARVKASLGGIPAGDTSEDALLSSIISSVSARFERYMRRTVLKQVHTKTMPVPRLDTMVRLDATPVESIAYVRYGSHPSALADNLSTDSYALEDELVGTLRFHFDTPLLTARRPGYLAIQYVGGMAEDTADFILLYPDIAHAADLQVAYEFQRRNTPGGNVTTEGGSTGFNGELGFLESVTATLNGYRRHLV